MEGYYPRNYKSPIPTSITTKGGSYDGTTELLKKIQTLILRQGNNKPGQLALTYYNRPNETNANYRTKTPLGNATTTTRNT